MSTCQCCGCPASADWPGRCLHRYMWCGKTQKLEGHHLSLTRTDRGNAQPDESPVRAVAGEELGEPLLMPWMPSMGGLAGSLPPDVHVVGFGKTASVFSSKQKPKELTIYGSDFRCRQSHCHTPVWHSPS